MNAESNSCLIGVRLLFGILCAVSFFQALIAFRTFPGEQAFNAKQYEKALESLNAIPDTLIWNPKTKHEKAQSLYEAGRKTKNEEWLKESYQRFDQLSSEIPFLGRAWLYRALSRTALLDLQNKTMEESDWSQIRHDLIQAKEHEPSSSWMAYMAGTNLLHYDERLTPKEKNMAMDWLKQSLNIHFDSQASYQMKDTLGFLWKKYSDFSLLTAVVPKDPYSYKKFLEFMDEFGLWKYRSPIFEEWENLSEVVYQEFLHKADDYLSMGKVALAHHYYEKAHWLNKQAMEANAGLLVSSAALGKNSLNQEQTFQAILESQETFALPIQQGIRKWIQEKQNPYWIGLQSFKDQEWEKAKENLLKVAEKERDSVWRKFYARTLQQLGDTKGASEVLKGVLSNPDPDFTELVLLEEFRGEESASAKEILDTKLSSLMPASKWWGESASGNLLSGVGIKKMGIVLRPGVLNLKMKAKGIAAANGEYPYVLIRVSSEILGAVYLDQTGETTLSFKAKTGGGNKKLEVLLLNGASETTQPGPQVELGEVEIHYL